MNVMVDWPTTAPFDLSATIRIESPTLGYAFQGQIEEYYVSLVDQHNVPANYTFPVAELRLKNAFKV